jgi:hypothetical protein
MTHAKTHAPQVFIFLTIISLGLTAQAQDWKSEKRINILFGLAQPVLAKGFNIEVNYIHNRFIFDYSHGASLEFSGNLLPNDLKRQQIAIHEPWTTGFGIGYRVKEWINVRVEPKWHKFEFFYDGEPQNNITEITSYTTFSLGVGVYGAYQPFKKKNNYLRGFLIAPSIRFWPTVSSGLENDKFTYLNKKTGSPEEIKTLDPGTGFTPWVFNVSIGYTLQLKNKK